MKKIDKVFAIITAVLMILCVVIAGIGAAFAIAGVKEEQTEKVVPTVPPAVAEPLDNEGKSTPTVPVQYEDPQESEKIEAALDWHYIEDCELTAYCPCAVCCGKEDGITATGTVAQEGVTIAVDPDVIPLGSWVEIDGHTYHAEDVGGAVNGNHIDIYFNSHDAAWDFGHRYANVRWYEGLEE